MSGYKVDQEALLSGSRNEINHSTTSNESQKNSDKKYNYVRCMLLVINFVYIVINILSYAMTFGISILEFQIWFLVNAFFGVVTIWKSPLDRGITRVKYTISHFIAYMGIFLYYLEEDLIRDEIESKKSLRMIQFVIASKIFMLLTELLFGIIGNRIYKVYDELKI